ncbi:MAG: YbaB/EbfC family nucleoid-associated protein [Candidatus Schekmanbacteria bacterium]|nr:YbaB/EbfC family nucleoid-associated protein [Candidatus Schekmanbacteria bacterium]
MKKGLGNLVKQAQQMQNKMMAVQEETAQKTVEASSGGGMVVAVVNGRQELISLTINPEVVDPKEVDMLQDLITAAVNKALADSQEMVREAISSVTGGMNIPGLF